jgi:hypothetical protein
MPLLPSFMLLSDPSASSLSASSALGQYYPLLPHRHRSPRGVNPWRRW